MSIITLYMGTHTSLSMYGYTTADQTAMSWAIEEIGNSIFFTEIIVLIKT